MNEVDVVLAYCLCNPAVFINQLAFGGKLLKGRPIYPGKNGSTSGEKEKNGEKKEKEKREKGEEAAGKKEKEQRKEGRNYWLPKGVHVGLKGGDLFLSKGEAVVFCWGCVLFGFQEAAAMGGFWVCFYFIFIWSGGSGGYPTKIIKSVDRPKPE